MRFGRMEKRYNQRTYANFVGLVEKTTGKSIGQREKDYLTKGADEIDLVRSGLEETMVTAYNEVMNCYYKKDKISDLRTAAFSCALNKVANDYITLGVFP